MKKWLLISTLCIFPLSALADRYQGQLTVNPYQPNAVSPHESRPNYGGPRLYDSQGNFRGRLNNNRYDPESVSNPYSRYGSPYSSDSINNPYGAGSPYHQDSPNNPYGRGLKIIGE